MTKMNGIKIYASSLIFYGAYTLLGATSYQQFSKVFMDFPTPAIFSVYLFTVLYGVCCVYCGLRLPKLENWARKTIIIAATISIVLGLSLNPMLSRNIRHLVDSGVIETSTISSDVMVRIMFFLTALLTMYELSVIYFFSRRSVKSMFRNR